MSRVTCTQHRQNLARYLDAAVEGGAPIVVTRQGGKGNVVMLSEDEFAGWQATVHAPLTRASRANDCRYHYERRKYRNPVTTTHVEGDRFAHFVIPAKAGTQARRAVPFARAPAFARMTIEVMPP
jgi:prevent-host-death family protein